ncbi:MAG: TatD family hydrolase [Bacteroidales bacterium]|nr:TatD family hydrolase [Bacteroidales bacterium]
MHFTDVHTHFFNAFNTFVIDVSDDFTKALKADFFSVGVHPRTEKTLEDLEDIFLALNLLAQEKNCVAIGECGFDKFSPLSLSEQEKIFKTQILIAQRFSKPLIIHCVRLYNEVIRVLKKTNFTLPVIFHGYNADIQTTKNLLKYPNINFSFTEKSLTGEKSLPEIPLERIFVESDTNEKTNFASLIKKIADIKNTGFDEIKTGIDKNFERLFCQF